MWFPKGSGSEYKFRTLLQSSGNFKSLFSRWIDTTRRYNEHFWEITIKGIYIPFDFKKMRTVTSSDLLDQ